MSRSSKFELNHIFFSMPKILSVCNSRCALLRSLIQLFVKLVITYLFSPSAFLLAQHAYLFVTLSSLHAMRSNRESGGIAPLILNLTTR